MSNCTSFLLQLCAIGGECIVQESSGVEKCQCHPGWGPDTTFFHPTIPDCSRPYSAFIGITIFQTLSAFMVCYQLYVQFFRTKGILQLLTKSWMGVVFSVWLVVFGVVVQDAFREVSSVALGAASIFTCRSGLLILQLLVEARYAVELQSPKKALSLIALCELVMVVAYVSCAIAQVISLQLGSEDDFNSTLEAWILITIIFQLLVPAVIFFHATKFSNSLQDMIDKTKTMNNNTNNLDEKPDVVRRLKIFREVVVILPLVMVPVFLVELSIFRIFQSNPLMWIGLSLVCQTFMLIGLRIQHLNSMILNFQDAKERKLLGVASADNSTSHVDQNPFSTIAADAIHMFHKGKFIFYLRPLRFPLTQETIFYYLLGKRQAQRLNEFVVTPVLLGAMHVVGPLTVVFCWAVLVMGDLGVSSNVAFLCFSGLVAIPFVTFVTLAQLSFPCMLQKLFLRSSSFQFRFLLVFISFFANYSIVSKTAPMVLACVIVMLTQLLVLLWDAFTLHKMKLCLVVFACSASVPFAMWYILANDLVMYFHPGQSRENHVYFSFFSSYHFACDVNLILIFCFFLDMMHIVKHGPLVALHFSAIMPVRYVALDALNERLETALQPGESDFAPPRKPEEEFPVFTERKTVVVKLRNNSILVTGNAPKSQKSKHKPEDSGMQRIVYSSLLIRESDTFLFLWCGPTWSKRILTWYEKHSNSVSLANGLLLSIPMTLWVCVVLTDVGPSSLSFLCLLSFLPLIFRFLIKSKLVLVFLISRTEFLLCFVIVCVSFSFLVLCLGFTSRTAIPLLILPLVMFDFLSSDAMVNLTFSSPVHVLYFLPVLLSHAFLLPIVGNMGLIANLDSSSFPLNFAQTNSTLFEEDVFLLENPMKGSFARIRFSQVVFDGMFALGVRLFLLWTNRVIGKKSLSEFVHISTPMKPEFVDFLSPSSGAQVGNIKEHAEIIVGSDARICPSSGQNTDGGINTSQPS